ncbi:MAG TPA: hypothetical protein VGT04_05390 [Acidobacteriaceae bacterium]|nr:hypothetical protein [Acidobacteriaceae bacterium]
MLLVMDQEADRAPDAEGLKVMLAEQLAEAASVDPQVVDATKSEGLVPETAGALSVTELEVVLETVMVCGLLEELTVTLPKLRLAGEAAMVPVLVPVPVRVTVSGVGLLLLVMDQEADRAPEAEGLKVMLAEQLAEAASVAPQVVDARKSEGLVPDTAGVLSVTELEVVLETVMDCELLEELVATLPKLRLPGDAATVPVPPVPVPVRDTC